AKLQMAAGAIGICTAKLGEAEALHAARLTQILMTTSNPSLRKIKRAMELRKKNPDFIQAVDFDVNAHDLSDAGKAAGITADVVIDVAVGTRSGIPAGEGAVALAKVVAKLPNLKPRGLLSYHGGAREAGRQAAESEPARAAVVRRRRAAHQRLRRAQGSRVERPCRKRAHARADKGGGIEYGNLQRRRHRNLQRPASDPGLHRRAGRQLHLHGH